MKVLGLRCRVAPEIEEFRRRGAQLLRADRIAGRRHLEFAVQQAERAMRRGKSICNELPMEVMVRAAATRQIGTAIERLGVQGHREVALVCEEVPKELLARYECAPCEDVLELSQEKVQELMEAYGIGEEEVEAAGGCGSRAEAVQLLVLERIALMWVE